jgi:hypothetical protein
MMEDFMGAPRDALGSIAEKIKNGMESMKYMKTAITGFTNEDLKVMSLDHKMQTFDKDFAAIGVKISLVSQGYAIASPLGVEAAKLQVLESKMKVMDDVNAYMKQHTATTKAYEAFYRQLNSQIANKINNLPSLDGVTAQLNEIITILNSPEIKPRITNKDVFALVDSHKTLLEALRGIHKSTEELKTEVQKTYKACADNHKQLDATAVALGRKLVEAGTAARERNARAAAGGAVHPAVEENKRSV